MKNNDSKKSPAKTPDLSDQKKKQLLFNKSRSLSLTNLHRSKPKDYSYVESKVKKYIERYRNQDSIQAFNTSVESSPSQLKSSVINIPIDSLLKIESSDSNETKLVKTHLQELNEGDNVVEKLSQLLLEERKSRAEQSETLAALQLNYDNLLADYAEAKNAIDTLRVSHESTGDTSWSNYSPREAPFTSTPDIFKVRRAFSASNLSEPSLKLTPQEYKYVKTSFSPIVDPKMTVNISLLPDKDTILSSGYASQENCLEIHQSVDPLPEEEWLSELSELKTKLKEYVLLEKNEAIDSIERRIFWNQTQVKFQELFDNCPTKNQDWQYRLTEIGTVMEAVSRKYCGKEPGFQMKLFTSSQNSESSVDSSSGKSHIEMSDNYGNGGYSIEKNKNSELAQVMKSAISSASSSDQTERKPPHESETLPSWQTYESSLGVSINLVDTSISDGNKSDTQTKNFKSITDPAIKRETCPKNQPQLGHKPMSNKSSSVPTFLHNTEKRQESAFSFRNPRYTDVSVASQPSSYAPSRDLSRLERNRMLLEAQLKNSKRTKRKQRSHPIRVTGEIVCCCNHDVALVRHGSCTDLRGGLGSCMSTRNITTRKLLPFTVRRTSSEHSLRVRTRLPSKSSDRASPIPLGKGDDDSLSEVMEVARNLKSQSEIMLELMKHKFKK